MTEIKEQTQPIDQRAIDQLAKFFQDEVYDDAFTALLRNAIANEDRQPVDAEVRLSRLTPVSRKNHALFEIVWLLGGDQWQPLGFHVDDYSWYGRVLVTGEQLNPDFKVQTKQQISELYKDHMDSAYDAALYAALLNDLHMESTQAVNDLFQKAFDIKAENPELARVWNAFGVTFFNSNGDKHAAEFAFKKSIEFDPEFLHAYKNLGRIFLKNNQIAEAEASFLQILEFSRGHADHLSAGTLSLLALAYLHPKTRDLSKAEEACAESVKLDPFSSNTWILLGQIFGSFGTRNRYLEAEVAFNRAIAVDPSNPKPHDNLDILAARYEREKEDGEGYGGYMALEVAPNSSFSWEMYGQFLLLQQRFDEAELALKKSIELYPDHTQAWCSLAPLLVKLGKNEEAAKARQKADEGLERFKESEPKKVKKERTLTLSITDDSGNTISAIFDEKTGDLGNYFARDLWQAVSSDVSSHGRILNLMAYQMTRCENSIHIEFLLDNKVVAVNLRHDSAVELYNAICSFVKQPRASVVQGYNNADLVFTEHDFFGEPASLESPEKCPAFSGEGNGEVETAANRKNTRKKEPVEKISYDLVSPEYKGQLFSSESTAPTINQDCTETISIRIENETLARLRRQSVTVVASINALLSYAIAKLEEEERALSLK